MDLGVSMCSKVWPPDTTWSPSQGRPQTYPQGPWRGQPLLRVGSDLRTPCSACSPAFLAARLTASRTSSHTRSVSARSPRGCQGGSETPGPGQVSNSPRLPSHPLDMGTVVPATRAPAAPNSGLLLRSSFSWVWTAAFSGDRSLVPACLLSASATRLEASLRPAVPFPYPPESAWASNPLACAKAGSFSTPAGLSQWHRGPTPHPGPLYHAGHVISL